MAPIPKVDWDNLQPFKAVEGNWDKIKPYYDNSMAVLGFGTILTAFIGTLSSIIKHGFKMPRLHPIIGLEELKPSWSHPNEYISEQDLADALLYEFTMAQRRQYLWNGEYEDNGPSQTSKGRSRDRMEEVKIENAD